MEGPIAAIDDTKEVCRNTPPRTVDRPCWESPSSVLPSSPAGACVDRRSQSSIHSPESVDKESGSSWGHCGEVSPPSSKYSEKTSLGPRSGEISPVFDPQSDVLSLESAQLTFRHMIPDPNSLGEDLLEPKMSRDSPVNAPVGTSSKEPSSSFSNFIPGEWQINRAHQMRGKNFVDDNEESSHNSPWGKHPENSLVHPLQALNDIEREKWTTSTVAVPGSISNPNKNPNTWPEGPNSWSMYDFVTDSNVESKAPGKVPVRSQYPAPNLSQSPVSAKEHSKINRRTPGYSKKIEDLLSSWEVFLGKLKSVEQTPTDLINSIETFLQLTKIEVGVNSKELETAFDGTSNVNIDKFKSPSIFDRVRNSLRYAMDPSLDTNQSAVLHPQQLCRTDLDGACCPSKETFLQSAETGSANSESRLDLLSQRGENLLIKTMFAANKPEDKETTPASQRAIRQCLPVNSSYIGNEDITSHESADDQEMKMQGEDVCHTDPAHVCDSNSENNTLTTEHSLTTDPADPSWSEWGIESSSQTNSKTSNSLGKMSSDVVTSTVNYVNEKWSKKEQEDSKSVQRSVRNENSLNANPNKGNANASSRNKNTHFHMECQPHMPDPVRVCANFNRDHANGETDLLSPCSKKVMNKNELNSAREDISDLADSREHLVVRFADSRTKEANEPSQIISGSSVRSFSSTESKHLEGDSQNCSSFDSVRTHVSEKVIGNCSLAEGFTCRKPRPSQKTSVSEMQIPGSRNIGSGQVGRNSLDENLVIINPNYNEHYRPTVKLECSYYNQPRGQNRERNHGAIDPWSPHRSPLYVSRAKSVRKYRLRSKHPERQARQEGEQLSRVSRNLPIQRSALVPELGVFKGNPPPYNPEYIRSQETRQMGNYSQHLSGYEYQPYYEKHRSYRARPSRCYQSQPSTYQAGGQYGVHQRTGFESYHSPIPSVYENTAGCHPSSIRYPEYYHQPIHPMYQRLRLNYPSSNYQ